MLRQNKNSSEFGFTQLVDSQQAGFIPMMIMLLTILIAAIVVVYMRVSSSQ